MSSVDAWRQAFLGEVAHTALGKMLDRGRSHGLPQVQYLRNVNVRWGRIDTTDLFSMELADDERDRFGVRTGDLLVCEGGEIGRAAIWTGDRGFIAYQKALHRVRPREQLESLFLRHYLEHAAQSGKLDSLATGTTIRHLPQQQLRRLMVPLPPVDEQRRIVDILEDHLSRLDAADEAIAKSNRRQAGLVEAGLQTALSSVTPERVSLASVLASPLTNGRSVPTADVGFPVLRLTALRGGRVDLSERKIGQWSRKDASPFLVTQGDYLIARGNGSISLVGRGAQVAAVQDDVAFPDTMIRIRLDPGLVSPQYFATVWNSREVRRQIEAMARTTAGIYKINQKQLASIQLPLPRRSVQETIVARMGALADAAEMLGDSLSATASRSAFLRRSLLAAAFSGKLSGAASDADRIEELAATR